MPQNLQSKLRCLFSVLDPDIRGEFQPSFEPQLLVLETQGARKFV